MTIIWLLAIYGFIDSSFALIRFVRFIVAKRREYREMAELEDMMFV